MTLQDKQLLAKDIFGRALTGLKVNYNGVTFTLGYNLYLEEGNVAFESYPMLYFLEGIETIKPYLRPMSSMDEKEREKFRKVGGVMSHNPQNDYYAISAFTPEAYDWLNSHHFDYRGLIEKDIALEAPEGMYNV